MSRGAGVEGIPFTAVREMTPILRRVLPTNFLRRPMVASMKCKPLEAMYWQTILKT